MNRIKITLEDAKAELRDAATGPRSQHWSYAPAVKALLNSHDELLSILGEATEALEEKDRQVKELLAAKEAQSVPVAMLDIQRNRDDKPFLLIENAAARELPDDIYQLFTARPAPAVPDDYFASLVAKARLSADKAMRKHPQPNYVLLKVAEEAGEVIQAGVHYAEGRMSWQDLEGEIVQLLAMLIRLVTEGDQVNGITPPLPAAPK